MNPIAKRTISALTTAALVVLAIIYAPPSWIKPVVTVLAGLVRSAWRYEGDKWIWDFTVPEGATASVTLPGESAAKPYAAGTYHIER